jgi:hypothetical protein
VILCSCSCEDGAQDHPVPLQRAEDLPRKGDPVRAHRLTAVSVPEQEVQVPVPQPSAPSKACLDRSIQEGTQEGPGAHFDASNTTASLRLCGNRSCKAMSKHAITLGKTISTPYSSHASQLLRYLASSCQPQLAATGFTESLHFLVMLSIL